MRIKIDSLDRLFAQYIKLRDKTCQYCGGTGGLQTAHFWGRGMKSVRWDVDNACLLCFGHHQYFHSRPLEYVEWFSNRLNEEAFINLQARANTPQKPDRELIRLKLKELIKEVENG